MTFSNSIIYLCRYPPFKILFCFIFKLSYKVVGFHMTLLYIISLVNPLPPPLHFSAPHFLSSLGLYRHCLYSCTYEEILNKF